jgi:hypothetical protein
MSEASLWITINPTDTHDPIAQVPAGQDINLDDLTIMQVLIRHTVQ